MASKARELANLGNAFSDGALSNRNLIINGAMQVAQRGNQAAVSTDGQYLTCDRFLYDKSGAVATIYSVSKDADAPAGFSSSLKLDVTTADTVASNEFERLEYRVEAQNVSFLNYGTSDAQQVTLSFWVKSNKTGIFAVTFYVQDSGRNIGSTYTINAADAWEYKTITFAGDTGGGGIANDNGSGIQIDWLLQAGSDWTSSDNTSWSGFTSGRLGYGHTATVGQSTSDYFQITGVQLEVGDTATPFEHRSYAEELQLCQRYFQKPGADYDYIWSGDCTSGSTYYLRWTLPVTMRATPTFTSLTSYLSRMSSSNFNPRSENVIQITGVCNSTGARGYFEGTYQLDAEL